MYEESFRFWKRLLEVHPEEVILAHLEVKSISLMSKLEIVNILYYYIRMIPEIFAVGVAYRDPTCDKCNIVEKRAPGL